MKVGTTKDKGLYNKLSAAVHPGALAAGTLPQYNAIQYNTDDYQPVRTSTGQKMKEVVGSAWRLHHYCQLTVKKVPAVLRSRSGIFRGI